ncbi:hypothetical protein HDU90_003230 [Geranomyces variabilis]|nr:hypothetical protein HDU90_003230 [Geranomyces variabilis]
MLAALLPPDVLGVIASSSADYRTAVNLACTAHAVAHAVPRQRQAEVCRHLDADFPELVLGSVEITDIVDYASAYCDLELLRWVYQRHPDEVREIIKLQAPILNKEDPFGPPRRLESLCYLLRFAFRGWLDGVKWLVEELGFSPCDPRYSESGDVKRNWEEIYIGSNNCGDPLSRFLLLVRSPIEAALLAPTYDCAVWLYECVATGDEDELQQAREYAARKAIMAGLERFFAYLWPMVRDGLAANADLTIDTVFAINNGQREELNLEARNFAILERVCEIVDLRPHAQRRLDQRESSDDPEGTDRLRAFVKTHLAYDPCANNDYLFRRAIDQIERRCTFGTLPPPVVCPTDPIFVAAAARPYEDLLLWLFKTMTGDEADLQEARVLAARRALRMQFVRVLEFLPLGGKTLATDAITEELSLGEKHLRVPVLEHLSSISVDLSPVADRILEVNLARLQSADLYRQLDERLVLEWVHTRLAYDLTCKDHWLLFAYAKRCHVNLHCLNYHLSNGVDVKTLAARVLWENRGQPSSDVIRLMCQNADVDLSLCGETMLLSACSLGDVDLV